MRPVKQLNSEQSQKVFHRICEQFATHCIPGEVYENDYYRNYLIAFRSEHASKPYPDIDTVSDRQDYRELIYHQHEYCRKECADQELLKSYESCKV